MKPIRPIDLAARRRNNDWVADAACAGHPDPDLWYPEAPQSEVAEAAKNICARCPVSTPCLTEALELNDRYGIRASVEQAQRIILLRRDNNARWEEQRVVAALRGQAIHLSKSERDSVAIAAVLADIDLQVWAPVLGVQRKRALTLIREARQYLDERPDSYARERRIAAELTSTGREVAA